MRLALLRRGVEELLDEPQLALPADERRLEADRLERAAAGRGDAEGVPEGDGLRLPLELESTGVDVRDRRLARSLGRLSDEDRAGLGHGLDSGGGVDEVAGDHALPLGAERDGGFSRQDAGAGAQAGN